MQPRRNCNFKCASSAGSRWPAHTPVSLRSAPAPQVPTTLCCLLANDTLLLSEGANGTAFRWGAEHTQCALACCRTQGKHMRSAAQSTALPPVPTPPHSRSHSTLLFVGWILAATGNFSVMLISSLIPGLASAPTAAATDAGKAGLHGATVLTADASAA